MFEIKYEEVAKKKNRVTPNYGAIGGSVTYIFTPTSFGTIKKVKHFSGNVLDITDYDSW